MFLTVKETADFLRVSEKQTYKLISNNKIPYIKLGGKILVDKNSLIDHLHKIEVKEA
ncbi:MULTISPECIES: helix-turn-helix domain-containing protein [Staphylococcus]|nr:MULTISPECIES: helix-turn-helix domain-containing protein [Staphylococcus]MEB7383127.1 helix-turn-helix domain-containing protein [Staphylococcus warneri]PNZ87056.1 DNA-binding protein [Staphylococcus devriesei]PTK50143.1 DNA-binding protein [Staphylococcus haemolyticus]PTK63340.1 DNA-binding protein [Staphylococcus haemolyticus]PTL02515.1 DNA-binding protein [Staphylococcus haemolyticus]